MKIFIDFQHTHVCCPKRFLSAQRQNIYFLTIDFLKINAQNGLSVRKMS